MATLAFSVTDADGRARADVPIRYGQVGRAPSILYSDPRGEASARVRGSTYDIEIPTGCWPRVHVYQAQHLRVGVPTGANQLIKLHVLKMVRRFSATAPVHWSPEPPWDRGRAATLTFTLWDTCAGAPAAGITFNDLAFAPTEGLNIIDEGDKRADAHGVASVEVACATTGNPRLMFGDSVDVADRIDLLRIVARPFDRSSPWCA